MIIRDQIYTLLMMKKRRNTLFSTVPIEIIKIMSDFGQDPNSEIANALKHAAYARKEDVEALLLMLDKDPGLLLQAGNVQTPGGNEIRRVTLYEFLLGAGNDELARIVQGYFDKIDNGEQEKIRQYERYKPHIERMLTEKPYDFLPLIELIKKATPLQIRALHHEDIIGEDDLCKAIIQFRKDWAPKVLTKPCMHYNYASLYHACKLFSHEKENLRQASYYNNMIHLVWRQLIVFAMRGLSCIDRCMIVQDLSFITHSKKIFMMSYSFMGAGSAHTLLVPRGYNSLVGLDKINHSTFFLPSGHPWPRDIIGELMLDKYLKLVKLDSTLKRTPCVIS